MLNGHRVLTSGEEPPPEGRPVSRAELRQSMAVFRAEGIDLDEFGRAQSSQRITARELAALRGLASVAELVSGEHQHIADSQRHFLKQLGEASGPQVAGAIQRLMEQWRAGEGEIHYGFGRASCAPAVKRGGEALAAIRIYPEKVEVPFGTLAKIWPFDDVTVREELRERLNAAREGRSRW